MMQALNSIDYKYCQAKQMCKILQKAYLIFFLSLFEQGFAWGIYKLFINIFNKNVWI